MPPTADGPQPAHSPSAHSPMTRLTGKPHAAPCLIPAHSPTAAGPPPFTHLALTAPRRPDRLLCYPTLPVCRSRTPQCSPLADDQTDWQAAGRCLSADRALTQRSHLAADRTDWYSARLWRSAARALTQRSRLVAARTI